MKSEAWLLGAPGAGAAVTTDVTAVTTVVGCGSGVVVGATYAVEGSAEMTDVEGGNVVAEARGDVVAAEETTAEVKGVADSVVAAASEGVVATVGTAAVYMLDVASRRRALGSMYLTTWWTLFARTPVDHVAVRADQYWQGDKE